MQQASKRLRPDVDPKTLSSANRLTTGASVSAPSMQMEKPHADHVGASCDVEQASPQPLGAGMCVEFQVILCVSGRQSTKS